jgi:pyrophosphatase PpaX
MVPETEGIIEEFDDYYRNSYNADVRSIKPYPYVKKVFESVKNKGIKVGVITTKSRRQALVTLNFYKLPYDVVMGYEDAKRRKPYPDPILEACKKLKLKPKDCVMVGDHPFDIISAKRAGSSGIGILTGWGDRKNLKKAGAAFIIKDLIGLIKLIER